MVCAPHRWAVPARFMIQAAPPLLCPERSTDFGTGFANCRADFLRLGGLFGEPFQIIKAFPRAFALFKRSELLGVIREHFAGVRHLLFLHLSFPPLPVPSPRVGRGVRSRLPCLYSTTLPPLLQLTKRRKRLRRKAFQILTLPESPERAFFAFEARKIPKSVYRAFLRVLRHTQKQRRRKEKKKVFSSDFLPRQNAQTTPRRGNAQKNGKAPHPRTHRRRTTRRRSSRGLLCRHCEPDHAPRKPAPIRPKANPKALPEVTPEARQTRKPKTPHTPHIIIQ